MRPPKKVVKLRRAREGKVWGALREELFEEKKGGKNNNETKRKALTAG
jgi:hypothetical protein